MSEEKALRMYPEDGGDVISILHDLSRSQADIIQSLEENSEVDCDSNSEIKATQKKILVKINDLIDHHFIKHEDEPSKEQDTSSSIPLLSALTITTLIIALASGIYSLDKLNTLNNEWEGVIERKIDEVSTLNRLIDFPKQKKTDQ